MKRSTSKHFEWLVPARSSIQGELLRLRRLLSKKTLGRGSPDRHMLVRLVGAAFSLWRAVFQAEASLTSPVNQKTMIQLLERVIKDNTVTYADEKTSWSFGYYLNNARLRLVELYPRLAPNERTVLLEGRIAHFRDEVIDQRRNAQTEWDNTFVALRQMIDALDRRFDGGANIPLSLRVKRRRKKSGDLRVKSVTFTAAELVVTLTDGRRISTPLDWYPRLLGASAQARANYEIMPLGIHWPDLDEDLSVAGMLAGNRAK